jgi:hypothetical protein
MVISMSFDVHMMGSLVPESYSRMLDEIVSHQEMPYGYTTEPPPADTGDFDQRRIESNKQYPKKHGRAV